MDGLELKSLLDKLKKLFEVNNTKELGEKLKDVVLNNKVEFYDEFIKIVGDLETDWLQKVYQYYEADREVNKQDYTPKCLAKLLTSQLGKMNYVYDQCAGSGSLTIQYWSKYKNTTFILEEYDENVIPYLLFNMAVRKINCYIARKDVISKENYQNYKIYNGKVEEINNYEIPYNKIEGCISNPPYNICWTMPFFGELDNRYRFGSPPESNANYVFIMNSIENAKKSALLLPNAVLTTDNKKEKQIRKALIQENLIESIITLPDKMFESTSIPTCIIILNKEKQDNKIDMIDLRNQYKVDHREQRGQFGGKSHENRVYKKEFKVIDDETIKKVKDYQLEKKEVKSIYKSVSINDIEDCVLSPSRYIELEIESNYRDIAEIVEDINEIIEDINVSKLTINESLAKAIGVDCFYEMQKENNEFTKKINESLKNINLKIEDEKFISLSKNKNEVKIENKDKDILSQILLVTISQWKSHLMYLNNKQNIYLCELRDVMINELMTNSDTGKKLLGEKE